MFAKCAGARRFTFNHHLARVQANLNAMSSASGEASSSVISSGAAISALSWSSFCFINEFNAWKNGKSADSPVNEDGSRGPSWRNELPSDVFECASVDAARALQNFADSRWGLRKGAPMGFPHFQIKGKVVSRFRLRNQSKSGEGPSTQPIRFCDSSHLRLPKCGPVKVHGSTRNVRRMIDAGRFYIYSATLTERAGRWIVSLTGVAAELHNSERSRSRRHAIPVGVDRGVVSLAVAADADGVLINVFEGVKMEDKTRRALKAADRALARTKPGSKGRVRARTRLAATHLKAANTRRRTVHRVSKALVTESQVLVIEDLDVAEMLRDRRFSRSISGAAMGELSRQIQYKAKWRGVEVRIADKYFPSSKTCSCCGKVKSVLDLSERTYSCAFCGFRIDRDVNAAINLARWKPNEASTRQSNEKLLIATS